MFRILFSQKEFPYLLTMLFVMLGWTMNRIIDSITEAPTLEYKVILKEEEGSYICVYSLQNISNNRRFSNIIFDIEQKAHDAKDSILATTIVSYPPASTRGIEREYEPDFAKFIINEFQPDWRYDLKLKLNHEPDLLISFTSEQDDILLKKASLSTFIVKNEMVISVCLILLWIILIFMYLLYLDKNEKSKP